MKNPLYLYRDKAVLAILVRLLDDKSISYSSTLYKAVKSCLEEVKDTEIKKILRPCIPEYAKSMYMVMPNNEIFYLDYISVEEALEHTDEEQVKKTREQFWLDCMKIREYIYENYGL